LGAADAQHFLGQAFLGDFLGAVAFLGEAVFLGDFLLMGYLPATFLGRVFFREAVFTIVVVA
jgi:hypothetical protein